jgi:hypothetical protein
MVAPNMKAVMMIIMITPVMSVMLMTAMLPGRTRATAASRSDDACGWTRGADIASRTGHFERLKSVGSRLRSWG